ncbi:MAG: haloacid dehalogenase [Chloroflexi bacterium RBG_19FT_COMBO_62_14]|nr:MAG: haloacid dehalogenase [Chloroflexi bacterium RBG_19FT_COMBO_62_14]
MSQMDQLDEIGERVRQQLEDKNAARDLALQHSRTLIRHCATAIRAVHRDDRPQAEQELNQAKDLRDRLRSDLEAYPDLYHAGYTQDALKEYAEARIVYALVGGEALPAPEALQVEVAPYLGGLGEAAGELRRRVLDILRHGELEEAERLLGAMDDIYGLLVTLDFPDALTGGLRRVTDMVRGVTERTRGDLTTSVQQRQLQEALQGVEKKLDRS